MRKSVVVSMLMIGLSYGHAMAQPVSFKSPFRYVVVRDTSEIQRYVNEPDRASLEVLLDEPAFTEKNLLQLFKLLAERYREPLVHIWLFTSLDAIRTPEEWDRTNLWGPVENYAKYKYAVFIRDGNGERFIYGIPGVIDSKEVRTKSADSGLSRPKGKVESKP